MRGRNGAILNNLLCLVGDDYKRTGQHSEEDVVVFLNKWTFIDVSNEKDDPLSFPGQKSSKFRYATNNEFYEAFICMTSH